MKKILLILGLFAVLLAACAKNKDFNAIKKGMKSKDVIAKLGEPTEKQVRPFGFSWWIYGDKAMVVMSADTVADVVMNNNKTK